MAAGGSGGHLVPALAIAAALQRARTDARISFIGTARGLTEDLAARAGYTTHHTSMRPFARSLRGVVGPLSLLPATVQARRILRRERADVVVGMGGYPSLPAITAARLSGVPTLVHEGNAVPGLANEAAARLTRNIAVTFASTLERFPGARVTGMPLRDAIVAFDRTQLRAEAMEAFDLDPTRKTVLVFGGSLGAATLSRAAAGLAIRWATRSDVQMIIVAGATIEATTARLAAAGVDLASAPGSARAVVRLLGYIDRMELAYAAADVVVARAGASTVCEIAAVGTAAILVPLPHARRREQHVNAASLGDIGAAIVVEDETLTVERLETLVGDLLADDAARARMAAAARTIARPDAADELAAWICELAEARGA